jgi:hypothetical protein
MHVSSMETGVRMHEEVGVFAAVFGSVIVLGIY